MSIRGKKLDKLLRSAFHEQSEKIVPPSSQKLWAELQQRPEFASLGEIEAHIAGIQGEQKHERKVLATFWRKHRYVSGLVAACLVLFVIFIRLTPFYGGPGGFVNKLLTLTQGVKSRTEEISLQSEVADESSQASTGEKESDSILKSYPLRANQEEGAPEPFDSAPSLAEGEQETGQDQGQEREFQIFNFEESEAQQGSLEAEGERDLQAQEAQELTFEEEESFTLTLNEVTHLATEGVWRIKHLPGKFNFRKGTIIKTENALLSVQQEYENDEGNTFSLVQQFLGEEKVAGRFVTPAGSLDQQIQVGPYNGYLRRDEPGFHTLTWLQDNSIVTLSGELEEKQLYEILASMEERSPKQDRSQN